MVRTLRYNRTFAEAGRGDPEMRDDDEKRSWLDELKEILGLQSRQRRPRNCRCAPAFHWGISLSHYC